MISQLDLTWTQNNEHEPPTTVFSCYDLTTEKARWWRIASLLPVCSPWNPGQRLGNPSPLQLPPSILNPRTNLREEGVGRTGSMEGQDKVKVPVPTWMNFTLLSCLPELLILFQEAKLFCYFRLLTAGLVLFTVFLLSLNKSAVLIILF